MGHVPTSEILRHREEEAELGPTDWTQWVVAPPGYDVGLKHTRHVCGLRQNCPLVTWLMLY